MLTQLFLAALEEGKPALPYARAIIRSGLAATAERLNVISPDLATQFLDVEFPDANFADRFLLSAWGTLSLPECGRFFPKPLSARSLAQTSTRAIS